MSVMSAAKVSSRSMERAKYLAGNEVTELFERRDDWTGIGCPSQRDPVRYIQAI